MKMTKQVFLIKHQYVARLSLFNESGAVMVHILPISMPYDAGNFTEIGRIRQSYMPGSWVILWESRQLSGRREVGKLPVVRR